MNKRQINEVTTEPAPMEQVRELLFGAQLKDMETRFKRQEERFVREVSDAKESLKTRIDSLENFMKSEIVSILARIKEEQNEREETIKAEQRERAEQLAAEHRDRADAVRMLKLLSGREHQVITAVTIRDCHRTKTFSVTSDSYTPAAISSFLTFIAFNPSSSPMACKDIPES